MARRPEGEDPPTGIFLSTRGGRTRSHEKIDCPRPDSVRKANESVGTCAPKVLGLNWALENAQAPSSGAH